MAGSFVEKIIYRSDINIYRRPPLKGKQVVALHRENTYCHPPLRSRSVFNPLALRDGGSCAAPPQMGPTSYLWTNQSRRAMTHSGDSTEAGKDGKLLYISTL